MKIADLMQAANGQWEYILPTIGVEIPANNRHGACPTCGGKDRFRFDNKEGRGTWFCSQCVPQAGDGLDLVKKAINASTSDAIKAVAAALGKNTVTKRKSNYHQAIKTHPVQATKAQQTQKRAQAMFKATIQGESAYLSGKGLTQHTPLLSSEQSLTIQGIQFCAGDIFLPLYNQENTIVSAQLIKATGEKRFLPGGQKTGSFHIVPGDAEQLAVCEGYATALTVNMATNATTFVAFDCGNLKAVSLHVRKQYPDAQITIYGDNDLHTLNNPGKSKAEEAAKAIKAKTKIPHCPGDWNDYFLTHGLAVTQKEISKSEPSLNQTEIEKVNGRALEPSELQRLHELGSIYSHIVVGARHRVMILKHCPVDGLRPTFESVSEFQNYFLHLPDIAGLNQGKAWLSWPGKTFYSNGIGYYPDIHNLPDNCYNLFQGWGVNPLQTSGLDHDADLAIIKTHLCDVICDGHEESYQYLIRWLAQMLQKPEKKPPVAILMKSVEGAGKGTLYEIIKAMLGSNAYQVNGNGQLVGRFNSIIDGRLFVFGDEVDMTDKRQYDKLKSLISEKTQSVERKGLEPEPVRVLARFMFTGNHDHLIKAGTNERRWLVLEPSSAKQNDMNYWDNLYAAIDGNAPAKLLHFLLQLDLTDFNIRRPPVTQGLIEQKLASLKIQEVWIYEELASATPFDGRSRITATDAVDSFIAFALSHGEQKTKPQARSLVGKMMGAAGLTVTGRSDRGDGYRYYDIHEVNDMRLEFAKYLKHKPDEIF